MRRNRTLAALAAAASVTCLFVGPAAAGSAAERPTTEPAAARAADGCVKQGETGLYLSKEGEAKLTYSPEFREALAQAGVRGEGVAPNTVDEDGAVRLPIGEKYDNIELPSGRVCYPGGMKFVNERTDATYTVDDFWIKFEAVGNSKVFTTPNINGSPRPGGELNLANFTVEQAFRSGQWRPHNDGFGPTQVRFTIDPEFADDLNRHLGTDIAPGTPWATLDIAWRGAPTRALPTTDNPELAGLRRFSDALDAYWSSPVGALGGR